MKRTLFTILLLALTTFIHAQPTPKYPKDISLVPLRATDTIPVNGVYTAVEREPEFPGDLEAFNEFLSKNLKYPKTSTDVQGKVFLEFIVEMNGSLSNMRVVKSLGTDFDNEALRVMKLCPAWSPGLHNGKPVRVRYRIPINFELK